MTWPSAPGVRASGALGLGFLSPLSPARGRLEPRTVTFANAFLTTCLPSGTRMSSAGTSDGASSSGVASM